MRPSQHSASGWRLAVRAQQGARSLLRGDGRLMFRPSDSQDGPRRSARGFAALVRTRAGESLQLIDFIVGGIGIDSAIHVIDIYGPFFSRETVLPPLLPLARRIRRRLKKRYFKSYTLRVIWS